MRSLILATALTFCTPAIAQTVPVPPAAPPSAEAILATAPAGTRIGLLVVDEEGREVIAIRPDDRFIPASNTKLFTTAAAYALLGDKMARARLGTEEFGRYAPGAFIGLAEQDGSVAETEHALHWFARGIRHNPQVRAMLTQRTMADVDKSSLVDDLLGGRAPDQAVWLMRAIVSAPRRPVLESAFNEIFRMAAERRRSQYADVRTATPLTDDQVARLSAVLERLIGRPVQIGVTIDPSVLGGLRVHVGDLVFDGTTSARLELARRSLVAS